jgi:hypothetical protein
VTRKPFLARPITPSKHPRKGTPLINRSRVVNVG